MISSDILTVFAQSQSVLGKRVSDLVSSSTKVLASGAVIGTLHYVTGYDEFSSSEDERSGHYLPLKLGKEYDSKPVTVQRNDGSPKTETDTEWVLRVPEQSTTFSIKADGVSDLTLSFAGAVLETPVGKKGISLAEDETIFEKPYSDYCGDDTDINWMYTSGRVYGAIRRQADGSYKLPLKLDTSLADRNITFKGAFEGVEGVQDAKDKTLWLVTLGNDETFKSKSLAIKCDGQQLASLTFANVSCEEPE